MSAWTIVRADESAIPFVMVHRDELVMAVLRPKWEARVRSADASKA